MKPLIYIITGNQGEGKTTFVKELADLFKKDGFKCSGFYAEGYWKHNLRYQFDLVEINELEREVLCNTEHEENDIQFRRFFFKPKALESGKCILIDAAGSRAVVFIDEVGMFELENKGWAEAIDRLLLDPPLALILSVRTDFAEEVRKKFNLISASERNIAITDPEIMFSEIKTELNQYQ
ncbi:MAG: nucleoside-triphosphatase [Bacteroidales bacterium]